MKEKYERLYKSMKSGLDTAHSYISDDMEAICDETFESYAQSTLEELDKSIGDARSLHALAEKEIPFFLDAMTDIAVHLGWQQLTFQDSRQRNALIRQWTEEFVDAHDDTDWQSTDYIMEVDAFAEKKIQQYRLEHPDEIDRQQEKPYKISFVHGTQAVNEYAEAVDCGKKWNISSLCDCGSVSHGEFATQAELDAYKQGVDDASGYLEYERMMTDEEWAQYLEENKDIFNDEDDE